MILGIDTSLPMLSVALVDGVRAVGAVMIEGEGSRNEKLLPAIDWLLAGAGVERSAVDCVVVTRGPGSFTGVRIGLATAQGIAFSLGVPLVAMSTHEPYAGGAGDSVLVHGDAGRGERYVSAYRDGEEVIAPLLATAEELDRLRAEFSSAVDLDDAPRRSCLALAAALRVAESPAGGRERWTDATPIYVRASEADVRLEKRLAAESEGA